MLHRKFASRIALLLALVAMFAAVGVAPTAAQNTIPKKDWKLDIKRTSASGKNPDYTITTSQPVVQTTDKSADALNKAIDAYIQKAISEFKDSVSQGTGAPPSDMGSFLDIRYDIYGSDSGLISIKFIADEYMQGAAHPGSGSYSLNYNLNTGKMIALADLFKPGTDYLTIISKIAIAQLTAEDRISFPDGAAPKAENYQVWNLDHEGIMITFDEYQVGPYAAGPSDIYISYIALGDALADTNLFFQ